MVCCFVVLLMLWLYHAQLFLFLSFWYQGRAWDTQGAAPAFEVCSALAVGSLAVTSITWPKLPMPGRTPRGEALWEPVFWYFASSFSSKFMEKQELIGMAHMGSSSPVYYALTQGTKWSKNNNAMFCGADGKHSVEWTEPQVFWRWPFRCPQDRKVLGAKEPSQGFEKELICFCRIKPCAFLFSTWTSNPTPQHTSKWSTA